MSNGMQGAYSKMLGVVHTLFLVSSVREFNPQILNPSVRTEDFAQVAKCWWIILGNTVVLGVQEVLCNFI